MVDDKPTEHGTVTVDKDCFPVDSFASLQDADKTVTVTATPDKGYQLKSLVWKASSDHDITSEKSFPMPKSINVTVTAVFELIPAVLIGEQSYATLAAALDDAASGQTVTLSEDLTEAEAVALPTGVTLDLDGHALTVPGVTVFGTGLVTDGSTDGTGRLITDKGKFNYSPSGDAPRSVEVSTVKNERVLPVWKDSGYSFCSMDHIGAAWATVGEDQPKFKFTLYSDEITAILESGSGVAVGIYLDYTRDGDHANDYLIDADVVAAYAEAGASNSHIYATFTGTEGITTMSAYTYLTSCGLRLYNASAGYDIGPN